MYIYVCALVAKSSNFFFLLFYQQCVLLSVSLYVFTRVLIPGKSVPRAANFFISYVCMSALTWFPLELCDPVQLFLVPLKVSLYERVPVCVSLYDVTIYECPYICVSLYILELCYPELLFLVPFKVRLPRYLSLCVRVSISRTHTHTHSLSLSLSLSHTHKHTHKHTHVLMHPHVAVYGAHSTESTSGEGGV